MTVALNVEVLVKSVVVNRKPYFQKRTEAATHTMNVYHSDMHANISDC